MDNFFEIAGPLIIGAIYVLSSLLSKKGEAEDKPPVPRQRPQQDLYAEDAESQRKVQSLKNAQVAQKEPRQIHIPVRKSALSQHDDTSGHFVEKTNNSYEEQMERQLKKIEATKREAARLQSKSNQWGIKTKGEIGSKRKDSITSSTSSMRSVRASLKKPSAARSAFIYGEVLGPPVSLRKTTGVLGLSS